MNQVSFQSCRNGYIGDSMLERSVVGIIVIMVAILECVDIVMNWIYSKIEKP